MNNKIKLLILDCDGVLTSGRKTYDKNGVCISKEFCDKDFSAIKRFRANGVKVCVLSGDPWNEVVFSNRNIHFINARGICKKSLINEICSSFEVSFEETAFVGDDLFDLGLLKTVGYPFVTSDSFLYDLAPENTAFLMSKGGDNVLVEIFHYCISRRLVNKLPFEEEFEKIQELDKNEKF